MAIAYNPSITTSGLLIHLDAANPKSYPGTGTVWKDISLTGNNGFLSTSSQFNLVDKTLSVTPSTVVYASNLTNPVIGSTSSFTIEFWLLLNESNVGGPFQNIIAYAGDYKNWGFRFGMGPSVVPGKIYPAFWTTESVPNNPDGIAVGTSTQVVLVSTGTYFHTAVTHDVSSGNTTVYANGTVGASTSTGLYINTSSMQLSIGGHYQGTNSLNGKIGSFKWYSRALTADEIQVNFAAHRGRYGV
jgi:hypothetical protein